MEKKNRLQSIGPFERYQELDLGAQIADLKLIFYQQSLLLSALIDLLIEKGCIQREELAELVMSIDGELTVRLEENTPTEQRAQEDE
ncbi:hypothetical protein ACFO25_10980 [Paenactinomyces guangxiensis]|uniref:Uncharacterized protein n=1 Tax=Paenactinomyces guangxiensis TaxID=1490290 RepID=A0A7W1WQM4_9BACL|nr:hypothetical protein [Paenactinomyces guangxiensis]MBA4494081.1 hypothetical protein [Paenactinomyces guangxiensis]MBH8591174.1 hypothetical protein [Paenactinomyces guangxiensis]